MGRKGVAAAPRRKPAPPAAPAETGIAVVGMAGRYPGAGSLAEWWENLRGGVDATGEVPAERWDWRTVFSPERGPGHSYSRWGGFLAGVDRFDAGFFDVPSAEAAALDPQLRLFLEVGWETVEDAGYAGPRSAGARAGVWVGYGHDHYQLQRVRHGGDAALGMTFTTALANRLSTFLDWRGPSLVVNTLCSSALVAVHQAVQSLLSGECDLALAGGVHAALAPEYYVAMSQLGSLSAAGRSRPFDAHADGYVPGEGAGAVLLKRLQDALADGDAIRGVIRGTAVNHGGRGNRMFALHLDAQAELVRQALERGGVHPDTVGYVEAHAVGTRLGDAIEVAALTRAFREQTERRGFCALGSVKPQIGHLEPAAGIAGLHKALLAMEHGQIPPTLHLERPNPALRLADSPFVLADALRDWPREDGPRRAGVSAFGMLGVNAHVIVEEAPPAPVRPAARTRPVHVLTLSARDPSALARLGDAFSGALEQGAAPVEDACFTSNTGRAAHPHRLAVTGATAGEIALRLREAVAAGAFARVGEGAPPRVAFLFEAPGEADGTGEELAWLLPALEALGSARSAEAVRALPGAAGRDLARAALLRACGVVPEAALGPGAAAFRAAIGAGPAEPSAEDEEALPGITHLVVLGDTCRVRPAGAGAEAAGTPVAGNEAVPALLAALWSLGAPVDWEAFDRGTARRRVPLPTYPFQRERFWLDAAADAGRREPARSGGDDVASATPVEDPEAGADAVEARTLRAVLGAVRRVSPATVVAGSEVSLLELGLDSAAITAVTQLLARELDAPLSPIVLFEHPTPARLVEHLLAEHPDACAALAGGVPAGELPEEEDGDGWTVDRLIAALERIAARVDALERALDR